MTKCSVLFALVLLFGCAEDEPAPFVQPGLDDPTARPFTKADVWYPADHEDLDADVQELLDAVGAGAPRRAVAILTPHAGLEDSGPVAAQVYARVEIPDRVIVLAPDHWGDGAPTAIWTEGPWLIPGHAIAIDDELVADLQLALPELVSDRVPFDNHEEEMQLPFLQWLHPEVRIAGLAISDNSRIYFQDFDVERVTAWGEALAELLTAYADRGERVLLITTTDLTHREPVEVADEKDMRMLSYVEALDVQGLYDYITQDEISMCGEIPTAIMMATLLALGHDSVEILGHGNSGHRDPTSVVGYPAAAAWE